MEVITFADLDDTLFSSTRKCSDITRHKVAAYLPDGLPGAYSTPQQQILISLLEKYTVIPVTGRRTDSLNRVLLSFNHYKVASHGAIILNEHNGIHPSWIKILEVEEPVWREKMVHLADEITSYIVKYSCNLRVRVVDDYGYSCYVCVKGDKYDLKKLQVYQADEISSEGFILHINDRNLAFMPPYASKGRAVAFLKKELTSTSTKSFTFFGLGDSISDAGFMSECDFQIIPSNSQIAEKLK